MVIAIERVEQFQPPRESFSIPENLINQVEPPKASANVVFKDGVETSRIEQLRERLENVLAQSNPLFLLTVEVNGDVEIIDGEPLSYAEQEWWKYVREKGANGPWRFIPERQKQNFFDIQEFFVARLELSLAQRELGEDEVKEAQERLDRITAKLDEMEEEHYNPIRLDITSALAYVIEKRSKGKV